MNVIFFIFLNNDFLQITNFKQIYLFVIKYKLNFLFENKKYVNTDNFFILFFYLIKYFLDKLDLI